MKALLLAAGLGTRLRPLTDHVPKCLVSINGKPLLQFWLEDLTSVGIDDILINTHYLSEKVDAFISSSGFAKNVQVVYEKKLLGTGGTLYKNRLFFEEDNIMLIHSDNLSKFDVRAFMERHKQRPIHTKMTMMTFNTDNPQNSGIVELDKNDTVIGFYEKVVNPPGNLANGAVYILEPEIFEFLASLNKEIIDFSIDVIPKYIGQIYTFHNGVYHRDIGDLKSYKQALQDFKIMVAP